MFYNDQFANILESSPFSTIGVVSLEGDEVANLHGFLCSGSYGQKEYGKGYATMKTEKRQSFKISLNGLPEGVTASDLMRRPMLIDGKSWVIDDITGNESGILSLSLKGGQNA